MTTPNTPQDTKKLEQPVLRVNPAKPKSKGVKGHSERSTILVRLNKALMLEFRALGFNQEDHETLVQTLVRRTHKARGLPQRLDLYPRVAIARDAQLSRVLQGDSLSPANLERLKALNRKAKRVARRKAQLEREGKL